MANQMLGMKGNGTPLPDPNKVPVPFRQFLYHEDFEARIFESQEAVDKALKDGWVDTPAKLKPKKIETGLKPTSTETEMLQKEVKALKNELIEASETIADQEQKLEALKKAIDNLVKTNSDLEIKISTLEKQVETNKAKK